MALASNGDVGCDRISGLLDVGSRARPPSMQLQGFTLHFEEPTMLTLQELAAASIANKLLAEEKTPDSVRMRLPDAAYKAVIAVLDQAVLDQFALFQKTIEQDFCRLYQFLKTFTPTQWWHCFKALCIPPRSPISPPKKGTPLVSLPAEFQSALEQVYEDPIVDSSSFLAKILLNKTVQYPCPSYRTHLTSAAYYGFDTVVKALLYEEDINQLDLLGYTALHQAICEIHVGTVALLLRHHANIHIRDNCHKRTPLHWAASVNNEIIISLLLAAGANPFLKDNFQCTPRECAHIPKIEQLLATAEHHLHF